MSRRGERVSYAKKWCMLSFAILLLLSTDFIGGGETYGKSEEAVVINPTPQSLDVRGEDFPLTPVVGLVVGDGTDSASVREVEDTLKAAGVKRIERRGADEDAPDTPVTIWVGGPSENPASVSVLESLNTEGPDELGEEGYVLVTDVDPNGRKQIVLAGHDPAGTFYAAQTFRQMIKERPGRAGVPSVEIRDWPDMPIRGAIEGFYGPPWSHEDRLNQLEFYGEHKMNAYIYAPKDDPYHREKWREPYPDEALMGLQELVDKAKEEHINFTFAISPGNTICFSDDHDFEALLDKAEAVWDLGVRSFAIFLDDIDPSLRCAQDIEKFGKDRNPPASAQAYLLNRFNSEFIQTHEGAERLITVPTEYPQPGPSPDREEFAAQVDPDVIVQCTGIGVVAPTITTEDAEKIHGIFKHDLLIWDNYPVNDYDRNRLFLHPIVGRDPNLTEHGVIGLTANPMNEAEASKIPLYTIADYVWNSTAYDPDESWERSILDFGGEAAAALRTFAEQSYSSQLNETESPTLAPLVQAFWDGYESGDFNESAQELLEEFERIKNAPTILRNQLKNEKFLEEVSPYLDKTELYGKAGVAAVKMLLSQQAKEDEAAWDQRLILQELFDKAGEIPQKIAENVIPSFLREALAKNDEWLGITIARPITTLGTYENYVPTNMIDGDPNTLYWSNEAVKFGDAVGIDLGEVLPVQNIELLMGSRDKPNDYIKNGILEYSVDGDNWTMLTEAINQSEIKIETDGIQARYIRFRAIADQIEWVQVRDIHVQIEGEIPTRAMTTLGTYQHYATANMIDGDDQTYYWSDEAAKAGDAVGVDLGDTFNVQKIEVLMGSSDSPDDYIHDGVLEYSVDGDNWVKITEGHGQPEIRIDTEDIQARYIRFRATADQTKWVQVREFRVQSDKEGMVTVSGKPSAAKESSLSAMVDKLPSRAYRASRAPEVGEAVTLTYPSQRYLHQVTLLQGRQSLAKAKIQIQSEDGNWVTVGTLTGSVTNVLVGLETTKIRLVWEEDSPAPIIYEVIPEWGSPVASAADIQELVERLDRGEEFAEDQAAHSLKIHLTAVHQYEKQEKVEKVIKHMESFKLLLEYQKENELISEKAYNILKSNADFLIVKIKT